MTMRTAREAIDAAIKDLIDQVPTMTVEKISLSPTEPALGQDVIARIDVSDNRYVLCRIRLSEGFANASLCAARVIES